MKKIFAIITALCAVCIGIGAYASDLNFTPEGGGKWIYCNNPERIRNCDLMNSGEFEPSYIMNNENLKADLYDFLICHINGTDTEDGYEKGYDIEIDMELTAVEDSVITINKAFFETPQDVAFIYSSGIWAKEMNKVSCLNSLASYLGVNLCEMNGSWMYEAQEYEPVTLEIKKGETVWLSDYIDNYSAVRYYAPMQMIGEIEINSGKMNFNVAAFKAGEELRDRSGFTNKAKFGSYVYDRTQKGIADTLPKMNAYVEYTITPSVKDGDYVKNKIFNQYEKDGNVTEAWCSHLSPQDDLWSKSITVESDLVTLNYKDDSKLTYYGERVRDNKKDNVWIWDPYHSDTTYYEGSPTWYSPQEYVPNYELSPRRSNQGYACSIGNYGVVESYNLKVKNTTDKDRYFEYIVETVSNVAVYVEDEDGKHSGLLKGEKSEAEQDTMASVKIPAKGEKEFSLNLVLPINYVGGIKNYFRISDESHAGKTYEDYLDEPRAAGGPLTYGVTAREVIDKLPGEVKEIVAGNEDNYEIIETDFGYMLRWFAWDGCPYYFASKWDRVKNMYILDKQYNIVDRYAFDCITDRALVYDGYYYIEDADGNHYRTKDGLNWEEYNHRLPLPDITFNNSKPSQWAENEIRRAYEIDVAPYDLKDKLVYTDNMTRETFCYVLSSMLELSDKMPQETGAAFTDTESQTISKLGTAGIISGYEDGTFKPKNSITRAEAAALLYRAAMYMGYDDFYENYKLSGYAYADDGEIGEWAKEAVYQMNKTGVMTGVGYNTFAPESEYTNEQSIATILRLYDAVNSRLEKDRENGLF